MKRLRTYLDTSIFGGCFDEEFAEDSLRLIEAVRFGRFTVLVTDIVVEELADAPERVRQVLQGLPVYAVERVELTPEILALRDAYLEADIVNERYRNDATHVAAATVSRADAIISWNFRHIVQLEKMKAYNRVNLSQGYGILTIVSPKEVIPHDRAKEEGV